jgi:hypothetical protein
MPRQTKIQRGYYPISYGDLIRRIGYCDNWGYGNKDTCKYVAETTIEQIQINHPKIPINDVLYAVLIGIAHDLNKGRRYPEQLMIPIKNI